jgi:outer membrane protein, multidrug efflux system
MRTLQLKNVKIKNLGLILAVLSLASCAGTGAKYTPQAYDLKEKMPAQWQATLPHDGKLTGMADWWQQFNDPLLSQLIAESQKVNADIATAKAKIVAAQTSVTTENANLLPSVTLDASATRSRQGLQFPSSTNANIGVNTNWEIDVWGRVKADKNAEEAKLTGTTALWHDARVMVAAETAKQYVNYRLCENLSLVALHNVDSTNETARLTKLTADAGFSSVASVSQAEAIAADAANLLKKQQLQCALNVKAMVALSAMPEIDLQKALDANKGVMPLPQTIVVDTVPANTLAQRPDLLNAERNLAAASFEIKSAQAQRYPRLSLAGNIGITYDTSVNRFSAGKKSSITDGFTWSIGPIAISLPIFDGGLREANLKAAIAQYEAAKIVYESTARNAVREVEDALVTLNSTASRLNDINKAAEGFKATLDATQTRYQANLANLFELEEARRASFQAESNVHSLENERVLAWIALYRAMGGGWNKVENKLPDSKVSENSTQLMLERGLKEIADAPTQSANNN